MGATITHIAPDLATLRTLGVKRFKHEELDYPPDMPGLGFGNKSKTVEEIRAGFGDDTLSANGAAWRTLHISLQRARRIVPTVEELRDDFLARRREVEEAQHAQAERAKPQLPEAQAAEEVAPAPQPRNPYPTEEVPPVAAQYPSAPETTPNPPAVPEGAITTNRLNLLI